MGTIEPVQSLLDHLVLDRLLLNKRRYNAASSVSCEGTL